MRVGVVFSLLALALGANLSIVDTVQNISSLSSLATVLTTKGYEPVLELLQGDGPFTVFAPNNGALASLTATDVDYVTAVLQYHIAAGNVTSASLEPLSFVESQLTNPDYVTRRLKAGQALELSNNGTTVTISFGVPGDDMTTATVVSADVLCTNGVIHIIDTLVIPPNKTSTVAAYADLKTLGLALVKAGLVDVVDTTPGITILAPSDAAFAAIGGIDNITEAELANILAYHVVRREAFSTELVDKETLLTLQNTTLTVAVSGSQISFKGSGGNMSSVITGNILTKNGVVHVIDAVLTPPAPTPPTPVTPVSQCEKDVVQWLVFGYIDFKTSFNMHLDSGHRSNDIGNYDRCMAIEGATHCIAALSPGSLTQGLCLPNSCTTENLIHVIDTVLPEYLEKIGVNMTFHADRHVHCGDNKQSLGAGGIVMILITTIFVILVAVATVVDWLRSGADESAQGLSMPLMGEDIQARGTNDKPKSMGGQLLGAFSLFETIPLLLHRSPTRGYYSLDGIRAISLLMIIIAHTANFFTIVGVDNPKDFYPPTGDLAGWFFLTFIFGAEYCVDSFFFLSAFLAALVMLKRLQKGGNLPVHLVVLHRFLRLVPTFLFVIFWYAYLAPSMGSGPFWYQMTQQSEACKTLWWTNILFINNFHPTAYADQCMPWTWYLANDFQFFIIGVLLVILYHKARKIAWGAIFVLLLVNIVSTIAVVVHYDLQLFSYAGADKYQNHTYDKPWCRIAPYLLGMGTTFVFRHSKFRVESKLVARALFVFACTIIAATTAGCYTEFHPVGQWSTAQNAIYITFSRYAWSVGLGIIIFLCITNQLPIVNGFLSLWIWDPIAKLTFSAYLLHPMLIRIFYFQQVALTHWSKALYFEKAVFFVGLSYACAAVLFCLVETPLATVEKLLTQGKKKQ